MELQQIVYVKAAAREQSFSKAAAALFVTQPALSKQIHAVEEELHVKLFERTAHGVKTTAEGRLFLECAEPILEGMENLNRTFHIGSEGKREEIRIGVFPFYRTTGLAGRITRFFDQERGSIGSMKVVENYEAIRLLQESKLDFAIIKIRPENIPGDLNYEVLNEESLYALISASHPLAEMDHIPVTELEQLPILTGDNDSHFYNDAKLLYQKYNLHFNVAFKNYMDVQMMTDMVEDGHGMMLTTTSTAQSLSGDRIKALEIQPVQRFETILLYRAGALRDSGFKKFYRFILSAMQDATA